MSFPVDELVRRIVAARAVNVATLEKRACSGCGHPRHTSEAESINHLRGQIEHADAVLELIESLKKAEAA